jgi:hypothetical protein
MLWEASLTPINHRRSYEVGIGIAESASETPPTSPERGGSSFRHHYVRIVGCTGHPSLPAKITV